MKYEKKSQVIDAIQVNNLRDVQTVLDNAPTVLGINDIYINTDGEFDQYVIFIDFSENHLVYLGQYVIWDSKGIRVMDRKKFEEKYRPSYSNNLTISTSPNITTSGTGFAKYAG